MSPAVRHPDLLDGPRTLWDLLEERARDTPEALALTVAGQSLTYSEWRTRALRVAAGLAERGVQPGERIVTVMHNNVEQLLIWLACCRIGAVWVPLNVALVGDDLIYTLTNANPSAVVVDAETEAKVAQAELGDVLLFSLAPVRELGFHPFGDLEAANLAPPEVDVERGDPAVIVYTGGTTGLPKGVVLPHFAYLAGGARYREFWQPRAGDVHFTVMQLYHVGCQFGAAIAPLVAGIPAVIDRWFSASGYWPRVRETAATLIDPLGTMIALLVKQPVDALDQDHRVRACWFATAHMPRSIRDTFETRFGLRLAPGSYALSECGGNYVVSGRLDDEDHPDGACGKPWGWAQLRIANPEGRPLQAGETGEILLRPTLANTFMLGYWRNPERTVECWRDLWLHTGDLGRVDEHGYLFFEGRQAHWMRRRGENVSAFEVESVLQQFPGVGEVAVVGVPSELGEDDIKAFVIPTSDAALQPEALYEWCSTKMTAFKVPRYIEIVEDFPRSATKREVERTLLRAAGHSTAWDAEAAGRAPRGQRIREEAGHGSR